MPRAGKLRQKKTQARRREREGEREGGGEEDEERKREIAQRSVLCEIILIGVLCHFTFLPTFIRRLPRSGKREFQFIFRSSTTFYLLPQHLLHGRVIILTFP